MIPRATLAAIHVAKKQTGVHDDDYRAMLQEQAGVGSAADLDEAGARRVLAWFENKGFTGTKSRSGTAGDRRPIVQKARALWISLHQLDEVQNPSDRALDAFAARLTGKPNLHFCTNGEAGRVVEALKSWCERVGVSAGTSEAVVAEQLRRLLEYAHALEQGAPARGEVGDVVAELQRVNATTLTAWRQLADRTGTAIRRLKLGRRHTESTQANGESNG